MNEEPERPPKPVENNPTPQPPRFAYRDWCIHDPVFDVRKYGFDPIDNPDLYYWNGWLWQRVKGEFRAVAPIREEELDRDVQERLKTWREIGLMPLDENDPEQVQRAREEWKRQVWSAPNPW
ncbi:hypothetical protein [Meiothermus sp.]|uniref:hypothetical protein n=1 Tax=Meiothermus sp. TaxID=1955249 RepID=UPI002606232B|nr:hypothetical protein [Meiothermus sp.]